MTRKKRKFSLIPQHPESTPDAGASREDALSRVLRTHMAFLPTAERAGCWPESSGQAIICLPFCKSKKQKNKQKRPPAPPPHPETFAQGCEY